MNTKTTFSALFAAAVFALTATPAKAQEIGYPAETATVSTLTRDEVRADVLNSKNRFDQQLHEWIRVSPMTAVIGMPLTRAQVHAETLEAIRVGALDRHEKNGAATAAQLDSIRQAGQRAVQMQVQMAAL